MSLRIRSNGRILCAAYNVEMPGDIYIDDSLHYTLSVLERILVTEPMPFHKQNGGEWWIRGMQPKDVVIENW